MIMLLSYVQSTRDESHSSVMFHVRYGSARPGKLPGDDIMPQLMKIIPYMQKSVYNIQKPE